MTRGGFQPRPPGQRLPASPRRVHGGVRASNADPSRAPDHWSAARLLELLRRSAAPDALEEGSRYARLGQTRTFEITPGLVRSSVQGREARPYTVELRFAIIPAEHWERIELAMTEQARFAAALLAGQLPEGVEELFFPLGLRLAPAEPSEIGTRCTCASKSAWCKHLCCAVLLLAERLEHDPMLLFELRGLGAAQLLERVERRRAAVATATSATGLTPLYSPRSPGVSDEQAPGIDQCTDSFWNAGPALHEVDLPIEPPQVSHPLLRRLGATPFTGAKFPLIGLLASCLDTIGEHALHAEENPHPPEPPTDASEDRPPGAAGE